MTKILSNIHFTWNPVGFHRFNGQFSALETYLEELKIKLVETPLVKPKNNLPPGEQRALKELINKKEIILKKADKGTTTVVMNKENKINEGQIQLDDRNNYQSLDKPMVRDAFQIDR